MRNILFYDEGEAYAAGDEERAQFDNDRLVSMIAILQILVPDPDLKRRIRRAVMFEIFGEHEER
jgi:hypothetical protein